MSFTGKRALSCEEEEKETDWQQHDVYENSYSFGLRLLQRCSFPFPHWGTEYLNNLQERRKFSLFFCVVLRKLKNFMAGYLFLINLEQKQLLSWTFSFLYLNLDAGLFPNSEFRSA